MQTNAWKWFLAALLILLVGFFTLGKNVASDFESVLSRQLGGAQNLLFSQVKRYKNGTVCGTVSSPSLAPQSFVVGAKQEVALDEATPEGSLIFKTLSQRYCHD